MTHLYSLLASQSTALRHAARECWPHGTVHTADDVIINGRSLLHSPSAVGSPAVRTPAEPTPAVRIAVAGGIWAGHPSTPQRFITVVLTRVEEIAGTPRGRRPEIWVDAELHRCRPIFTAARLVGRASTARRKRMQLRPHPDDVAGWVLLPGDLAPGDLIAVPCDGTAPLSDVRRRAPHEERLSEHRLQADDDDFPFAPSCRK